MAGVAFKFLLGFDVARLVAGDVCLDLPDGDTSNGNKLQLWSCTGGETQGWFFDDNSGALVYAADTTVCADAGDMFYTRDLVVWQCNGSPQQAMAYEQGAWHNNDNCIEAQSALPGGAVQVWRCDDTRGQQGWTNDFDNGIMYSNIPFALAVWSTTNGKCWDIPGSDFVQSQYLQLWDCGGGVDNQGWLWDGSQIRAAADLRICLDLPGGDTTSGNKLWLWQCNGSPSQEWGYNSDDGSIYSVNSNACIDVMNSADDGDNLMIWECNGLEKQQWSMSSSSFGGLGLELGGPQEPAKHSLMTVV